MTGEIPSGLPSNSITHSTTLYHILNRETTESTMRLIDTNTLVMSEFYGDNIPPYAILSHRWDTEEVTFQDMTAGMAPEKMGHSKISGCCEKARRDGWKFAVSLRLFMVYQLVINQYCLLRGLLSAILYPGGNTRPSTRCCCSLDPSLILLYKLVPHCLKPSFTLYLIVADTKSVDRLLLHRQKQ